MAEPSGTGDMEEVLTRLADVVRELAAPESLDEMLQRAVDLAAEHVPGCDGATLMLIRPGGEITTPAFSDRTAYESDRAQYLTGQGPCLEAIRDSETVRIDDLEQDERWPEFARHALDLGIRSSVSFQLFVVSNGGDSMGSLNLYSTEPHAFDERARAVGLVFASHLGVAMKAAITAAGLESALRSRDVIGQAKGILMERERLTPGAAFGRLRELSQRSNRPLRVIAEQLVETGAVPDELGG